MLSSTLESKTGGKMDIPSQEGMGTNALWGTSKALDLTHPLVLPTQPSLVQSSSSESITGSITESIPKCSSKAFLLVGQGDARSIIKTLASAASVSTPPPSLEFYLIEPQATLVSRGILLLSIFLDDFIPRPGQEVQPPPSLNAALGVEDRADLFLEVYGNLTIRQRTSDWIAQRASSIIRILTGDGMPKGPSMARASSSAESLTILQNCLDFSALKFRERDDIEMVLKYWRDPKKTFDGPLLWEHRLRAYYGIRYDSRENVLDWDYNMKMAPNTSIVHKSEFQRWRMTGISHGIRESVFNQSNRTMATVDLLRDQAQGGIKVPKWGYFSDIVTGPFIPFGSESEFQWMMKQANGKHVYTSEAVAKANLSSWIHAFHTRTAYTPLDAPSVAEPPNPAADDPTDASSANKEEVETKNDYYEPPKMTEIVDDDAENAIVTESKNVPVVSSETSATDLTPANSKSLVAETPLPPPISFKVCYLPCDSSITFEKHRSRYSAKFHRIFLSNSMAHRIVDCPPLLALSSTSSPDDPPCVLVEGALYLFDWRKDLAHAFAKKIMELAAGVGLKATSDDVNQEIFTFVRA